MCKFQRLTSLIKFYVNCVDYKLPPTFQRVEQYLEVGWLGHHFSCPNTSIQWKVLAFLGSSESCACPTGDKFKTIGEKGTFNFNCSS